MGKGVKYEGNQDHAHQVETMMACGLTIEQVALVMKISVSTIKRHYKEQIQTGGIRATAIVAQTIFRRATRDSKDPELERISTINSIFWMKANPHSRAAGWTERTETALVGEPNAPPIKAEVEFNIKFHKPGDTPSGG